MNARTWHVITHSHSDGMTHFNCEDTHIKTIDFGQRVGSHCSYLATDDGRVLFL